MEEGWEGEKRKRGGKGWGREKRRKNAKDGVEEREKRRRVDVHIGITTAHC